MDAIILPHAKVKKIYRQILNNGSIFGTTAGAAKQVNEDRIGYTKTPQALRACIADGHWGEAAADKIAKHWLSEVVDFPSTFNEALEATHNIEKHLYEAFGSPLMDAEKDKTPEAAFIAMELKDNILRLISYGDCRLLIVRQGKIYYQLPAKATWLGAFSYIGLRDRQSIHDALVFESIPLLQGDTVMLFTDGVDECVYEVPTINFSTLAEYGSAHPPAEAFNMIMDKVFDCGAEDNASLAVISLL